ncbi:hypothetical protein NFI96_015938 [Prochilodus magdalenae]|nr:hypothetical protein NFI96_015938 [Prochilodus magdalenae]
MCNGLRTITDYKGGGICNMGFSSSLADKLNAHNAHFKANDTSPATKLPADQETQTISVSEVVRSFKAVNPRKAPGPVGVHNQILMSDEIETMEEYYEKWLEKLKSLRAVQDCNVGLLTVLRNSVGSTLCWKKVVECYQGKNMNLTSFRTSTCFGFNPAHSTEADLVAVTKRLQTARSAKLSVLILLDLSAPLTHNDDPPTRKIIPRCEQTSQQTCQLRGLSWTTLTVRGVGTLGHGWAQKILSWGSSQKTSSPGEELCHAVYVEQ